MGRVLSISSQTVFGPVGNSVCVPALQSQGHDVMALPTVLLSHHPGHGNPHVVSYADDFLLGVVNDLDRLRQLAKVDAVLTGYFASAAQVKVAVEAISVIKAANPKAMVLVDPVMGDHGKLYVKEDIAVAIRDHLLPLASITTPNHFELSWLTGTSSATSAEALSAAAKLSVPEVIITSVPQQDGLISTFGVTRESTMAHHMRREEKVPNGTGDLLAGLYLAQRLKNPPQLAFAMTMKFVERAIQLSKGKPELVVAQTLFVH
jgi:pyridoxine kinase